MIRMAGTRLLEQAKQKIKTKQSTGERVQDARRYQKRPGELPSRVGVGRVGVSPINQALFQGDGYSAL